MTETLTTPQAAKLAGVSTSCIAKWHRADKISATLDGNRLAIDKASLTAWIEKRAERGRGFEARYRETAAPTDMLEAKEVAERAGVCTKTGRRRLASLRKRGTLKGTQGRGVRHRMWYYPPEAVVLVRDFKPAKPIDHVSNAVKKYGAEGAQRVARERERARLEGIPDWKRETTPGPRNGAACVCGYAGHGLIRTDRGWRCWPCVTDKR